MSGDIGIFIRAIEAVYEEEVTEGDYERAVDVSPGSHTTLSPDQVIPTAKVIAEEDHRYEALRFIYKNWERVGADLFDEKIPILLIEQREFHRLWDNREEHACVMRACSFFESYFLDMLDVHPSTNFGSAIDSAYSNNIISNDERKLFHFVREVRNECGHNSWLELEYPRELIQFAVTSSNFLVGELADRRLESMGVEPMELEVEATHFIRKAEEDFQWVCTEENGQIDWEAPDSWTHPDREYSTYEDVWEDLE